LTDDAVPPRPDMKVLAMIDGGASLIEGPIKRDLVLACETGSLRRLLEASGLAFRSLSLNFEENTPNQELFETLGVTDAADVVELRARTRIEEAHAHAPGALIIGAHQVVSLNGKVLESRRPLTPPATDCLNSVARRMSFTRRSR
jgi:predicted house-cleaning NTP pyrophosphatase (Maf/HAM1 superfamily)